MFVTTRITIDIASGKVLEHEGFLYPDDAPIAECKGDSTAKAQEQQQLQFNTQMMSIFQQQFANQKSTLDYLKGKLQPMIDNPTGLSAQALAATRTSATDQIAGQYENAQRALNNQQALKSGDLPSGVTAQLDAGLESDTAGAQSTAQNNITMQNEQLKNQNYWNSINALNGVAAQVNPLGYAGAYNQGSNNVSGLSQAVMYSQNSGVLGALVGGIAGAGTAAITKYCWCAAETFDGWTDPRTILVRSWLLNEYSHTFMGSIVCKLYQYTGRPVAALMRKSKVVKRLVSKLFYAALRRAEDWKTDARIL